MSDPITPLQQCAGILGEHYDHFVVIVNTEPHAFRVEFDNSLSALGMLRSATTLVDRQLMGSSEDDYEWVWDEDGDDDAEYE
jgi:hypothetical protein